MGHVTKTPAGTFRANWRDPAGRQKAKTFKTKRAASKATRAARASKLGRPSVAAGPWEELGAAN